jgi:hypothetical protein
VSLAFRPGFLPEQPHRELSAANESSRPSASISTNESILATRKKAVGYGTYGLVTRHVTSNPSFGDTDGDGLEDYWP